MPNIFRLGGGVFELPDGNSVFPVDDYKIWLECARLEDVYGSLPNIIASATARDILCNNQNALRYMTRSATIMSAVLANSGWIVALDSSTFAIKVPTITSANADIISGAYHANYPPYNAFDKIESGVACVLNSATLAGRYLGYNFKSNITFYKVRTWTSAGEASIGHIKSTTAQYSNNGTDWADGESLTGLSVSGEKITLLTGMNKGSYFRLYNIARADGLVGSTTVSIFELQLYGLSLS